MSLRLRGGGASAAIFAFTALSALTALIGSTAPKALLYLPLAAIGLGIAGSIAIGNHFARKGQARDATASAVSLVD